MSRILVNNRQKTFAVGICFSSHVMSIFRNLLLLLLSVNLLSSISSDCRKNLAFSVLTQPIVAAILTSNSRIAAATYRITLRISIARGCFLYCTRCSSKFAFFRRDPDLCHTVFLGPTESIPQTACRSVLPISINQSCIFAVVQVIKSLQDPLEVGNNLPGINDNVRERGLEQKCFKR